MPSIYHSTDLICFSHLRWNFVYQRPQHLLSRFSTITRVFYIEEPVGTADADHYKLTRESDQLIVVTPYLQHTANESDRVNAQRKLIQVLFTNENINKHWVWLYTPMSYPLIEGLYPVEVVYDCMDELSAFLHAPAEMKNYETLLMERADLIFTGGLSLYEARKEKYPDKTHLFPSSIDVAHFRRAREIKTTPPDVPQTNRPWVGFCGVIDERMDLPLLDEICKLKPEWDFMMIGPVVKIDPASLPSHPNLHYLGKKTYEELPAYFAGWNIAMIPFALNDATRYISPTKTPEYLAAGLPVVSTPVRDMVRTYGNSGLVHFAANAAEFVKSIEEALPNKNDVNWLRLADKELSGNSWDKTFQGMKELVEERWQSGRRASAGDFQEKALGSV